MDAVRSTRVWSVVCLVLVASGCARLRMFEPEIPDVHPLRQERSAEVVARFEQHRSEAEFQAARSFWKHGQREQAITHLEALVRREPQHVAAQQLLMEILLVDGQLERALTIADATAGLDDARIWHVRGLIYDAADRPDDAWRCLETAVRIEPRNEYYLASFKAFDESNHELSIEPAQSDTAERHKRSAAKSALAMAPACVLLTAETYLALGRYEAARQRLELLADQPQHASAVATLLRRIAAQAPVQPAMVAQAATASPPRRLPNRVVPATVFETDSNASPITVVHTSAEVATAPQISSPQTYLHEAGQALAAGHPETAALFLRKARELAPHDPELALSISVLPLRHEEYELACELAQEALRDYPELGGLYRALGTAQYRLGRWTSARDALQRAISLDNRDGLSYFLMGCTLNKLGQKTEADTYLRQAQTLDRRYAPGTVMR